MCAYQVFRVTKRVHRWHEIKLYQGKEEENLKCDVVALRRQACSVKARIMVLYLFPTNFDFFLRIYKGTCALCVFASTIFQMCTSPCFVIGMK